MAHDEREISALLDTLEQALFAKNAPGAIEPLSDDAVTFDLAPPLQHGPALTHDPARLEEGSRPGRAPSRPSRESERSSSAKMWPTPMGYNG
jgi:hypothetical protein